MFEPISAGWQCAVSFILRLHLCSSITSSSPHASPSCVQSYHCVCLQQCLHSAGDLSILPRGSAERWARDSWYSDAVFISRATELELFVFIRSFVFHTPSSLPRTPSCLTSLLILTLEWLLLYYSVLPLGRNHDLLSTLVHGATVLVGATTRRASSPPPAPLAASPRATRRPLVSCGPPRRVRVVRGLSELLSRPHRLATCAAVAWCHARTQPARTGPRDTSTTTAATLF